MWSATQALNGLIGVGVPQDWATHMIAHELTALYQIDHAATLAIVLPRLMWEMRDTKQDKIIQYAQRVWGITETDSETCVKRAIEKTEQFFNEMQIKTHLSEYDLEGQSGEQAVDAIIDQLTRHGMTALGEKQLITLEKSRAILMGSL